MNRARFAHIVVPLDGSPMAEQVLPYVEDLARTFGSTVTLIRVGEVQWVGAENPAAIPPISPSATPAGAPIDLLQVNTPPLDYTAPLAQPHEVEDTAATGYLNIVSNRLRDQGINVQQEELEGPTAEAIIERAVSLQASLIAMATHGRGGIERLIFGSIADEVLRHAPCPVLVLRTRATDE